MHTIDGKPARFDGHQIVYASFYGKANPLAISLEQIKAEQRKSRKWRERQGWVRHDLPGKYGHLRFRLPESHDE